MTLKEIIRSRTREGWAEFLREKFTDLRIWIQEHGEKAAVLTFVIGLLIALLFKLFVFLVVAVVIFGYVVWFIALPQSEVHPANQSRFGTPAETDVKSGDSTTRYEDPRS